MPTASVKRPNGPDGHFMFTVLPKLRASPYQFFLNCVLEYGDFTHFRFGPADVYLTAAPDTIQEILVTRSDEFSKSNISRHTLRRVLGNGILVSEGAYHKRQRKMVQPAFHTRRITAYADTMVAYTQAMLETWQPDTQRDIHTDMMTLTMEIVAKTLFNADVKAEAHQVGKVIEELQYIAGEYGRRVFNWPDWMPTPTNVRRRRLMRQLNDVVMGFIEQRRQEGDVDHGDLLSMLLRSEDENGQRMTDDEVRDEATVLFAAGHETTSNALTWTWYLLAQNPDVRQQWYDELATVLQGRPPTLDDLKQLPYTHQILKESMRLYPPAWNLMGRQAQRDLELAGYPIKAGSVVLISPYAIHRNPRYWQDPDAFKPERFTPENEKALHKYQYLPFGGGPRVCIGNSFAMMEAALVLATMGQRYQLDLVPGQVVEPVAMVTLFPKEGVQMRLTERETQPEMLSQAVAAL